MGKEPPVPGIRSAVAGTSSHPGPPVTPSLTLDKPPRVQTPLIRVLPRLCQNPHGIRVNQARKLQVPGTSVVNATILTVVLLGPTPLLWLPILYPTIKVEA